MGGGRGECQAPRSDEPDDRPVIDEQERINGSLDRLQVKRRERGLDEVPLRAVGVRTAAQVLAIRRVAAVTLDRGIWP